MTSGIPQPLQDELPSAYAHRVGQWFLSWNKPRKELGQVFTPLPVAQFMAQLVPSRAGLQRILDPGAGVGVLSCALCEIVEGDVDLEAYETDEELTVYLKACLAYAESWMQARNRHLTYRVLSDDFVLAHAPALYFSNNRKLFDIVISNPPYFKLNKSDRRARAAELVVHGQPNIYALFMAVSAALLHLGGYAVYITPRSFAAGQYFGRFREHFFAQMRPRWIHLFESRRDVFSDVLQESIIMLAQRSATDSDVTLSASTHRLDFNRMTKRKLTLSEVISADNILRISLSNQADEIIKIVHSWTGSLHQYGMEISTGPVVPFRATHLVTGKGSVPATHAPLLWMQNVKPMQCIWPQRHKGQYLLVSGADKLLLPNQNYVLLRRFSAKEENKRLTAAPYLATIDTPVIGLENHLNYIYRPAGTLSEDEARGLAALLNSDLMDAYFRTSNGNTQVSATEIRRLPLPPIEAIVEIGRLASRGDMKVTDLVTDVLGLYA